MLQPQTADQSTKLLFVRFYSLHLSQQFFSYVWTGHSGLIQLCVLLKATTQWHWWGSNLQPLDLKTSTLNHWATEEAMTNNRRMTSSKATSAHFPREMIADKKGVEGHKILYNKIMTMMHWNLTTHQPVCVISIIINDPTQNPPQNMLVLLLFNTCWLLLPNNDQTQNPLLYSLFFRSCHHYLFLDNIENTRKIQLKFWILLKILWKMEHLLQKSKCSISHILKCKIFKMCQR